ncbi:MAG: crossover junction endodeoxyribonuclease RuvC [Candidatus Yanofskybacteria bacterium CG10_big_fil_rev_8_21_14_0_10_37_15]|uniref:Crossover junction endodeoxyribonuclease RuvC n=1 Tax=Candidatus Yanofskybacteria bacterium CG10_big_fil_rev_8_21_14_0_10_37_15 TaxID=1975097 RepID=A0A2H0R625_9BACT|nr:MAG: crossover junction endodeoxyribonuclease RuvC [Candidatus Yanofskybacteria bacterium CG10_big_fil_rev_8_21_14_0_10_37_15]
MTILGIDPGTTKIGFGVIKNERNSFEALDYGIISTPGKNKCFDYKMISEKLSFIINTYKPERAGVEKLFFSNNQKTAMSVAEARGVIILTLANHNVPIVEFAPHQVKQAVSAYGSAGKAQVERMVRIILKIKDPIRPDDAADALAIAICATSNTIY